MCICFNEWEEYSGCFKTCKVSSLQKRLCMCDLIITHIHSTPSPFSSLDFLTCLHTSSKWALPKNGWCVERICQEESCLPCWVLVPSCQRSTLRQFEEESVSVWSEQDYLVSTSSCAGARICVCTCISKPNLCVCVCICVHTCHFSIIFHFPPLRASFPVQTCPNLRREAERDGTQRGVCVKHSKPTQRHTFMCYFQARACCTSAVFLFTFIFHQTRERKQRWNLEITLLHQIMSLAHQEITHNGADDCLILQWGCYQASMWSNSSIFTAFWSLGL